MSRIDVRNISKSYGANQVLKDVSLSIEPGEFVAILGPSGCGKTTLLRALAGFETVDDGEIHLDGQLMSGRGQHVPPERRKVGVVFQNYALWPHMTVAENVAYGLKIAGVARQARMARVGNILELVNLTDKAGHRPANLSGGQRQRVALARCLAMESRIVLLDEPLANLDIHLRGAMEDEFAAFHKRSGATMFYITHDQGEAMGLADKVAVMEAGRIVQFDRPDVLFRQPINAGVAGFIGDGRVLEADDIRPMGDGRASAFIMGQRVQLRCAADQKPLARGQVALRPDDVQIAGRQSDGVPATIVQTSFRGASLRLRLATGPRRDVPLSLNVSAPSSLVEGQSISVAFRDGWIIPQPHSLASSP